MKARICDYLAFTYTSSSMTLTICCCSDRRGWRHRRSASWRHDDVTSDVTAAASGRSVRAVNLSMDQYQAIRRVCLCLSLSVCGLSVHSVVTGTADITLNNVLRVWSAVVQPLIEEPAVYVMRRRHWSINDRHRLIGWSSRVTRTGIESLIIHRTTDDSRASCKRLAHRDQQQVAANRLVIDNLT